MAESTSEPNVAINEPPAPVLENELPTYRAISTWAVGSLILGLLAAFSFADPTFLVAAAGAIGAGAMGLRMIGKYPDLLTGRGLANVGIGLGLVCGLSSATLNFVQKQILVRQAKAFAELYCETLAEGDFAEIIYLQAPPAQRAETTPERMLEELQATPGESFEGDPRTATIRDLQDKLRRSADEHVHLARIEDVVYDGITPVAYALIVFDGPEAEKNPAEQYAMAALRSADFQGGRQWYVESVRYPYQVGSTAQVVESAHGHDH